MAFRCQRIVSHFRSGQSKLSFLDPSKSAAVGAVQVANLTSAQSHGYEIQHAKPWPYKKRPYNAYWQFVDHTRKRFNDNSKIIIVDGNVATGKSELAEKIAKEFDMHYIPDPRDETVFICDSGFDLRTLNDQLPPAARMLDIATFQMKDSPPAMLKSIGRTQLYIYLHRFVEYVNALEHLLNTGQGVVLERGPWSDAVFAETLRRNGYLSPKALNYYNLWRGNTVCELWKPHLVIYLDGSVGEIQKRINERNHSSEVKGKVLTAAYLQSIEDVYKKKVLPTYRQHSEVLTYDITDMPDWEIIVEDMERLDLDKPNDDQKDLFKNWQKPSEDDWNHYRCLMASKWQLFNLFQAVPMAWEAPEMMFSGDDFDDYQRIVVENPDVKFARGYNPDKSNVLLKMW